MDTCCRPERQQPNKVMRSNPHRTGPDDDLVFQDCNRHIPFGHRRLRNRRVRQTISRSTD